MKLWWTDSSTQLYLGNASKLDQIDSDSIDMILTDPSYGIDYVTGRRQRSPKSVVATLERFDPIASDDRFHTSMMHNAIWEMFRILKGETAVYIFTRFDVYPKLLPLVQEVFTVKNVLTWAKNNWSVGDLNGNYAYQTEMILYAVKGNHKLQGSRGTNLLPFKRVDGAKLVHPAQKPVDLLSYLITKSCPEGGIVLDPFVGSGSTCVAAADTGRKSIGVDIEERWLEVAKKRLEHKFLPLFEATPVAPQNFELFYEGDEE